LSRATTPTDFVLQPTHGGHTDCPTANPNPAKETGCFQANDGLKVIFLMTVEDDPAKRYCDSATHDSKSLKKDA